MGKLQLTIEKGDNERWGLIKGIENYLPTSVADTISELIKKLRELLQDWQQHEGKDDPVWSR